MVLVTFVRCLGLRARLLLALMVVLALAAAGAGTARATQILQQPRLLLLLGLQPRRQCQ
jgi:hypothetical protein